MHNEGVLFDTDFLIAYVLAGESTHHRAKQLFSAIEACKWMMLTVVKYELATVLSRKIGQALAWHIFQDIVSNPIAVVSTESHEKDIWREFASQQKKNISFTDCANIVVARKYGFKIASFDAFYPKELLAG